VAYLYLVRRPRQALVTSEPMLKKNRSAPNSGVIPVLYYPEVRKAVEWLTTALPLIERLRIGDHRCQLVHDNGAIVIASPGGHADDAPSTLQSPGAHRVMLRVKGVDKLFERAKGAGARVLAEPADHMYGERQCSFLDPWGRPWTLSETIFDSDPSDWGGELLVEE
jgi:uncharacterized glyoxalase superfamily protein PhnB